MNGYQHGAKEVGPGHHVDGKCGICGRQSSRTLRFAWSVCLVCDVDPKAKHQG